MFLLKPSFFWSDVFLLLQVGLWILPRLSIQPRSCRMATLSSNAGESNESTKNKRELRFLSDGGTPNGPGFYFRDDVSFFLLVGSHHHDPFTLPKSESVWDNVQAMSIKSLNWTRWGVWTELRVATGLGDSPPSPEPKFFISYSFEDKIGQILGAQPPPPLQELCPCLGSATVVWSLLGSVHAYYDRSENQSRESGSVKIPQ